ncbi:MAG: hypothetical protein M1825_001879 [Sarcosagium campestre]|nr:MAG: hypothetical protein M1825_001879 [Sarcosagium campestre]
MISRSSLRQSAQSGLSRRCCAQAVHRRGLAAAASGSFQYRTGTVDGIKVASRDLAGPTTTLGLVAKAGTRYEFFPGFTEGLEKFAFKSQQHRSALRITREVELLGGELQAYHSRENIVIGAKFMREDLPYFVELLADVAAKTKYSDHEFQEEVVPTVKLAQKSILADTKEFAINSAHGVAFHRGLGNPLHPTSSTPLVKYLNEEYLAAFGQAVYSKPNFAIVANGTEQEELSKWVGEFFTETPSEYPEGAPKLESDPTKYYGGEERISHASGNTVVLAFPGSSAHTAGSSYKPEISVLAALLGGESGIKWSPGFSLMAKVASKHPGVRISTKNHAYSDAGLLCITLTGPAQQLRLASAEAVQHLKAIGTGEISDEDIKKATAAAKFNALEAGQKIEAGIELTGAGLVHGDKAHQMDDVAKGIDGVTPAQLKKAAKTLLEGKASVSSVGDLFLLPYAEDIGLKI